LSITDFPEAVGKPIEGESEGAEFCPGVLRLGEKKAAPGFESGGKSASRSHRQEYSENSKCRGKYPLKRGKPLDR
jgi:hypothetical protein